jgi:carbon starvation protein
MFGTANQLLAGIALCVGTTFIIRLGRAKYAWVTMAPMAFVMATTLSAAWMNIVDNFLPMTQKEGMAHQAYVNIAFTAVMMLCAIIIIIDSIRVWIKKLYIERGQAELGDEGAVRD